MFQGKNEKRLLKGNNHQASFLDQQSRPPLELTTQLRDLGPDSEHV